MTRFRVLTQTETRIVLLEHVARLLRVPLQRIDYWRTQPVVDRLKILAAAIDHDDDDSPPKDRDGA